MDSDKKPIGQRVLLYAVLLMIIGITLGALGAHWLEKQGLETKTINSWKTGVLYQLLMAGGILLMIVLEKVLLLNSVRIAAIILAVGVSMFSFSIYLLALNHLWNIEIISKIMGPITPLGGILMITAWIIFGIKILKTK
ncbi:MAG: DUF423 domain-containing protein [Flavobacteriales bacterium]|nr:DUF423 domain-containing protein [Flavobacteriales bacterium]